jgi:phosphoribosylanthranilate isomerase
VVSPLKPLLKICGNHDERDVETVIHSETDYLGFVFVPSKRQVTIEMVEKWLAKWPNRKQKIVALFVNEAVDVIKDVVETLSIDVVQCHGNESPEDLKELKKHLPCPIWKVIHAKDDALSYMRQFNGLADGYIVDCKVEGYWGGTGQTFDWEMIPTFLAEGKAQGVNVMIAGGVSPQNIDKLLSYQPGGIDISSGVESNGRKDRHKIEQIVERMTRK